MKILVVDDKQLNRDSAFETLGDDHDVTVADSFDEAMHLLVATDDPSGPFDAVLTDMEMPMSSNNIQPPIYQPGVEVPYGPFIVLRAALVGVKYIGMFTDGHHHSGPMQAALDFIKPQISPALPNFEINGATAVLMHADVFSDKRSCSLGCHAYDDSIPADQDQPADQNDLDCSDCEGWGEVEIPGTRRKNWKTLLDVLTN